MVKADCRLHNCGGAEGHAQKTRSVGRPAWAWRRAPARSLQLRLLTDATRRNSRTVGCRERGNALALPEGGRAHTWRWREDIHCFFCFFNRHQKASKLSQFHFIPPDFKTPLRLTSESKYRRSTSEIKILVRCVFALLLPAIRLLRLFLEPP